MSMLTLSIPTYNRCELLRTCLTSVHSADDPLAHEVIVVDNGSTDGTAEMVARDFPRVHLLRNPQNRGFSRANNQAFGAAQGTYFLLLNSDTVVLPGALETMVRFMDRHPEAGVVGPRVLNMDGTVQPTVFCRFPSFLTSLVANTLANVWLDRLFPAWNYPGRFVAAVEVTEDPREVCHLMGACLMVRSHLYRELGMLDERFFIFREETDLCQRVRAAGRKIYYLPAATVRHHGASGQAAWHPTQQAWRVTLSVESEWLYHGKYHGAWAGLWLVLANLIAVAMSVVCLWGLVTVFAWHPGRRRFLSALARDRWTAFVAFVRLLPRALGALWRRREPTCAMAERLGETRGPPMTSTAAGRRILNVGAGRDRSLVGAVSIDRSPGTMPDVLHDLDQLPWPLPTGAFDVIYCKDVLEHLEHIVGVMEEIHRVGAPGARLFITTPHFSCANAYRDPTHRHAFSIFSFDYFTRETPWDFYTTVRFRTVRRHLFFSPKKKNALLWRFANRFPAFYEEHLAWIFPAWFLSVELEVLK